MKKIIKSIITEIKNTAINTGRAIYKNWNYLLMEANIESEDIAQNTIDLLFKMVAALGASVVLGLTTYNIIATGGLAALLAQLMAYTCTGSDNIPCNFNTLLGGVGMALVLVTSIAIVTLRVIRDAENKIANSSIYDTEKEKDPVKYYNEEMADVLRFIIALGPEIECLRTLAIYKGINYSTLRRWVYQFQSDGYVRVHSNGKGAPVRIEVLG